MTTTPNDSALPGDPDFDPLPATFRDAEGLKWTLTIDLPTANRVRQLTGVNLFGDTGKLLETLADPINLVDVMYAICKKQADRAGLTDEDFGRRCAVDLEYPTRVILQQVAICLQRLGQKKKAQLTVSILSRATKALATIAKDTNPDQIDQVVELVFGTLEEQAQAAARRIQTTMKTTASSPEAPPEASGICATNLPPSPTSPAPGKTD